jgi:hypothetical protein
MATTEASSSGSPANNWLEKIRGYFTWQELIIILVIAALAFLTGNYGLSYVLPGGPGPGFVHAFLKMPGPGTGIFNVSAFVCLWLVLGLLVIKKPGTALLIAVLIMIFGLAFALALGGHHGGFNSMNRTASHGGSAVHSQGSTMQSTAGGGASAAGAYEGMPAGGQQSLPLDYLGLVVAIIIEIAGLLALEKKPWRYIFPAFLVIMGLTTLVLMATGNAKMGENGAAATVFPLGYAVTGILALCLAVILFMYPAGKYIVGAGCAEMFYLVFCWAFNGKSGLFSWAPVAPAIPPILTFAFVFGAVAAAIAYGGILLWNTYTRYGVNKT